MLPVVTQHLQAMHMGSQHLPGHCCPSCSPGECHKMFPLPSFQG